MKILVVDDSAAIRRMIRAALEAMGESVLEARDGQDALETVRKEEVDLALVDWNMPRLDGIGFLKRLKEEARDLAVIMVTSEARREHVEEALRWGARDYLVKPFDLKDLREKVRNVAAGLDALPFLERLPGDLAMEIRALGTPASYEAGTILVPAGRKVNLLHVLLKGDVEVISAEGAVETRHAGEWFGEDAFLDEAPSRETARARGAVLVLSLSRPQVADLLRRRPEAAGALRRRTSWPAPPLAGNLDTLPLADLARILNVCRKTGRLRLERGAERADLYFADGELRHAVLGGLQGEPAFTALLDWPSARFRFEAGERAPAVTIPGPTLALLIDAARRESAGD